MKDDPKTVKKLDKLLAKIYTKCDKKKYSKIPNEELSEVLNIATSLEDKEQIRYLYIKYKTFIPDSFLKKIENMLGIKKETEKKDVAVKEISTSIIEPVKYVDDNLDYKSKSYDELPKETKESIEQFKKLGFLFPVTKTIKRYSNYEEELIYDEMEKSYGSTVQVYWSNDTKLSVKVHGPVEKLSLPDAVKKYKDNPYFMVRLNHLLGLSIYTPYTVYIDDEEIERTKVLK